MKRNLRRSLVYTTLFLIAVSLVVFPQRTSALRATVTLAEDNQGFSTGRFFRTGLTASDQSAGLNGGGVQLIPVKVQPNWPPDQSLPIPLSSHTSASYNDRIFVVGGNTLDGDNVVKTNAFFATRLADASNGRLQSWTSQPTLPTLPIAVSDPASVVVQVNGQPYLFVLGGIRSTAAKLDDVTTSRIFYYPIRSDANGYLAVDQWAEINNAKQRLPHETFLGEGGAPNIRGGGARGLSAVSVQVNGTPYIYIFGGNNRFFRGSGYIDWYSNMVWRAPVTMVGSTLQLGPAGCANPGECWEEVGAIGGLSNTVLPGLSGAATTTFTDPATGATGVYLIGGQLCKSNCADNDGALSPDVQSESRVFVGKITTDGTLSWLEQGSMSLARDSHDAVQARGQIMVAAGRNGDVPSSSLAQGFVEDDLTLYKPGDAEANFDLQQGAMNAQPRMNHTMEVLSGGQYGDYAYIIGGRVQVSGNTITQASTSVVFGNLAVPPQAGDSFVSDGKYYSKIYDFGQDAEFFKLNWKTLMADGQVVRMQYRIGPDALSLSNQPWLGDDTPQDTNDEPGFASTNGDNTRTFPANTKGQYIQFMVVLKRAATGLTQSPILDSVSVDVDRKGFPNAKVADQTGFSITPNPITFGSTILPKLTVSNTAFNAVTPALDADYTTPGKGTFFVDLYATYVPAGGATPPPPQFGVTDSVAYTEIKKPFLAVNQTFVVDPLNWRANSCNVAPCPAINWNTVFNQTGTYAVYIMVDSLDPVTYNALPTDSPERQYGNLQESNAGNTLGESDNILGPYTVTVSQQQPKNYLAIVAGASGQMGGTAQQDVLVRKPRIHMSDASR